MTWSFYGKRLRKRYICVFCRGFWTPAFYKTIQKQILFLSVIQRRYKVLSLRHGWFEFHVFFIFYFLPFGFSVQIKSNVSMLVKLIKYKFRFLSSKNWNLLIYLILIFTYTFSNINQLLSYISNRNLFSNWIHII